MCMSLVFPDTPKPPCTKTYDNGDILVAKYRLPIITAVIYYFKLQTARNLQCVNQNFIFTAKLV